MGKGNGLVDNSLLGLGFALMVAAVSLIAAYVPTEAEMGVVQRIFYFHVPLAWVAFLAFFVVFIMSILYLWKRNERWDFWAYSSAEVGMVFTTMVLITGPIWAKPAWGVWWAWDMRLTTTLVLWLIYAAYFAVRSFAAEEERGDETEAASGRLKEVFGMENYGYFLGAYIVVWVVVFAYVFSISVRQRKLRREIESLREELRDRGQN